MSARPYSAVFLAFLVFTCAFVVFPVKAQPAQGDWVITGTKTIQNQVIILNGNLTVPSGASLVLRNATLVMNCQFNGQYQILVEKGGSLQIEDSNITASDYGSRFAFIVEADDFLLKDSCLSGAGWREDWQPTGGWSILPLDQVCGFRLEGNNSVIQNNTFSHNYIAITVAGSNTTIINNHFNDSDWQCIYFFETGFNNTVEGNSFFSKHTSIFVIGNGDNTKIIGNTMIDNNPAGMGGIRLWGVNISICDNIIDVTYAMLLSPCVNALVTNNGIKCIENGLAIFQGKNNWVEGNYNLTENGYTMYIGFTHDTVILNNNGPNQIVLDHSSNNTVINNNVLEGMVLFKAKNNTISGNSINLIFSLFASSEWNLITNNNFSVDWFTVDNSLGNQFHENNFYFTRDWVILFDNGGNQWNTSSVGNYWNVYTGLDSNMDHVGDEPFPILHASPNFMEGYDIIDDWDYLPSMSPFEIVNIASPPLSYIPESEGAGGQYYGMDWNGTTLVLENQTYNLEAGFDVLEGCTLEIRNCTITMGSKGLCAFNVRGGTVIIEDSIIKDADYGYGYGFEAGGNSTIIIRNSQIYGVMRADIQSICLDQAKSAVFENSIFGEMPRVCSWNTPTRIINCTFVDMTVGLLVYGSKNVDIIGCTVHALNGGFAIGGGCENVTIANNTVLRTLNYGIDISGDNYNVTIYGNTLMNSPDGIVAESSGAIVFHNNFIQNGADYSLRAPTMQPGIIDGNYWDEYQGEDTNYDGIGDSPYYDQSVSIVVDDHPYTQENGWLTRFYLTMNTTFGSMPFVINGTSFATGADGTAAQRLGYVDDYLIWVPPSYSIGEGTWAIFTRWGDGLEDNSRVLRLSSNHSLSAEYKVQYSTVFNFTAGTISVVDRSQHDAGAIVNCTVVSSPGYQLKDITTTGGVSLIAVNGNIATFVVNGPGTATGNYVSFLADYTLYYAIIAIVAVAAIGVGIYLLKRK